MRKVQAELLDELQHEHPDAQASRRDLWWINQIMGNFRWFSKCLAEMECTTQKLLELGAGDGALANYLSERQTIAHYRAIDRAPRPKNWPENFSWKCGDLLEENSFESTSLVLANFILHHFEDSELRRIGTFIENSGAAVVLANETHRANHHKLALRAGLLIGFNSVTLNDGSISIDAGFRGDELPEKLGLDSAHWQWSIQTTFLGAYRMRAWRRKEDHR